MCGVVRDRDVVGVVKTIRHDARNALITIAAICALIWVAITSDALRSSHARARELERRQEEIIAEVKRVRARELAQQVECTERVERLESRAAEIERRQKLLHQWQSVLYSSSRRQRPTGFGRWSR